MGKPTVSVIMSAYNESGYIKGSVESILNQSLKKLELIVIEDGSNDSTWRILKTLKDPRLRLHKNKKCLGLTKSLNIAIKKAKGEYIARMDADDVAKKERLKHQINYLENHKDVMALGTWAQQIDEKSKKQKIKKVPLTTNSIKKNIPRFNPFIHPTLTFRAEVFKLIGMYDENFYFAQDYDLMLRITSKYKTANLPEPLFFYRVSDKQISSYNMSKQLKYAFAARLKALKEGNLKIWQSIYLVKPAISMFIPQDIKKLIIKFFSK